jgi:dipeptidyl aminopeptidase/acylaminoacyl peptidase
VTAHPAVRSSRAGLREFLSRTPTGLERVLAEIRRYLAPHSGSPFSRFRRAGFAIALSGLSSVFLATGMAPSADAAVLPALIAYVGSTGIDVVQPGVVTSARPFYTPATGTGTSFPTWSPDGQTLAFGVNTPHGIGIGLANRSGVLVAEVLLPHLVGPPSIAWSPDGTQIAYLCLDPPILTTPSPSPYVQRNRFYNVCALDVVTGASRVLARSTLSEGISAVAADRMSWSPSGDVIAVTAERDIADGNCEGFACGQPNIGLVDVSSGTIQALGGTDNFDEPVFSPKEDEIAASNLHTRGGVYIMSANGEDIREIVPASDGGAEPNWSPDGKELVFQAASGYLATVVVAQGTPKQATDGVAGAPSWVGPVTLCTVPKLIGQTLAAAKRLVALAGCVLGDVTGPKVNRNSLHVVKQEPSAHTNVAVGTKVNIRIR